MTKPHISWRNAKLPEKTAVFAVGDIHGHDRLLTPMLAEIEKKVAALPPDVTAEVIFIGDYIDRGTNTPKTVDMLLEFEKRMQRFPSARVTFLCGNHDAIFRNLLNTRAILDEPVGDLKNKEDFSHCVPYKDGAMNLRGLEDWLFSGGGRTTVKQYIPDLDPGLLDETHKCFNRNDPNYVAKANAVIRTLAERVSMHPGHKEFFERVHDNSHVIVGDYLFTHAGVDPDKSLAEQGIGADARSMDDKAYFDFLMLRNPFLWREDDNLPNCP